jgi:predicted DNA-binding transcriptional regulator AlpA
MSDGAEIMAEIREAEEIAWYTGGASRGIKDKVTLEKTGQIGIGFDLMRNWPKDKPYTRIGYLRERRELILEPSASGGQGLLKMQRFDRDQRATRIGAVKALRGWGLIGSEVKRCEAAWRSGRLIVQLGDRIEPRATGDEGRSGDLIDRVDRIDDNDAASAASAASAVASPSPSVVSVPSVAKASSPSDDDLIDILQVTQLAKCSEPSLYNWMRGKGFPRPVHRQGKKCFWSRRAVAQWLVDRDSRPKHRRIQKQPEKKPPCCGNCGDAAKIGKRTLCRSQSKDNPNRNKSVEPTHTCDWHHEPGTYVPVRLDDED